MGGHGHGGLLNSYGGSNAVSNSPCTALDDFADTAQDSYHGHGGIFATAIGGNGGNGGCGKTINLFMHQQKNIDRVIMPTCIISGNYNPGGHASVVIG